MERYLCGASSLGGFIQQLAVSYVGRGYWFYVTGQIPEHKEAGSVDAKFIERYGLGLSKWARARRKQAGGANLQYLRFGRFFVLLATKGIHPFFQDEGRLIRDVRRVPIKFGGYAVSYRAGHAHVRIERAEYLNLKAFFLDRASRRPRAVIEDDFRHLPYEPYAPVRSQLLCVLRAVNARRKAAGLDTISGDCLRLKRRIYRPFEERGSLPGREWFRHPPPE